MAGFDGKFESAKQEWTTPPDLFATVDAEFGFTLDAAADEENALCAEFIDEHADAMDTPWGAHTVWLNPPYGARGKYSLKSWVERAYSQSLAGATVVMLIPARTNTAWFHDVCLQHGEVRFVRGRPKFGGAKHGLPQPLCFVIFRPDGSSDAR